ncbi:tetratricopeptide repeat protein [Thiobacillus sp.]|uniref:tetratricopeptide repeat protein n=1 Tax=Thiobacillus sp. TaxID=924 RepID=UPI0025D57A6E|nr:tetratricopeptide repeat protein [Thiobacillus sp.]
MTLSKTIGLAGLAALFAMPAAQAAWAPTAAEMAALPAYCGARFNEGSDAFKAWRANMGGDFNHIHHYCAGLNFLNRTYGISSAKDRQSTLGAVVREFDYVLTHASPGFYLRAEILMNRGVALSLQKKPGEAIANLNQAIEKNPELPRAWMTLADLYETQKQRAKALETVTEGLRHNPGTRSLQRRYTELGGKLPYPEPIKPEPTQAATPPEAATPPAVEPAATAAQPAEAAPAQTTQTPERTQTPETTAPKIGSPTNPYCRFCPD